MIRTIGQTLAELGFAHVEDSTETVSFRVRYDGLVADENWQPAAFELYSVELWINELTDLEDTQVLVEHACRAAYSNIVNRLDLRLYTMTVRPVLDDSDSEAATVEMSFQTTMSRSSWDDDE